MNTGPRRRRRPVGSGSWLTDLRSLPSLALGARGRVLRGEHRRRGALARVGRIGRRRGCVVARAWRVPGWWRCPNRAGRFTSTRLGASRSTRASRRPRDEGHGKSIRETLDSTSLVARHSIITRAGRSILVANSRATGPIVSWGRSSPGLPAAHDAWKCLRLSPPGTRSSQPSGSRRDGARVRRDRQRCRLPPGGSHVFPPGLRDRKLIVAPTTWTRSPSPFRRLARASASPGGRKISSSSAGRVPSSSSDATSRRRRGRGRRDSGSPCRVLRGLPAARAGGDRDRLTLSCGADDNLRWQSLDKAVGMGAISRRCSSSASSDSSSSRRRGGYNVAAVWRVHGGLLLFLRRCSPTTAAATIAQVDLRSRALEMTSARRRGGARHNTSWSRGERLELEHHLALDTRRSSVGRGWITPTCCAAAASRIRESGFVREGGGRGCGIRKR